MFYKLRDYQRQAVDAAVKYMEREDNRNGVVVLPTGSGKSLVIANIAYRLDAPIVVFQPNKEILEQNYTKMISYGITNVGVFSASFNRRELEKITFATIGSVKAYKDYFKRFKYAIIDECHYVNAEEGMYKEFIKHTQLKVLGLTATPYRLHSSRKTGSILKILTHTKPRIFDDIVFCLQVSHLSNQGYLAPLKYFDYKVVNPRLLKVNHTGMDFSDDSIKRYYAQIQFHERLSDIVLRLMKEGRKNILVFTRFTEEAEHLVKTVGVGAEAVTGDTPPKQRDELLRRFKSGEINVIANVGVLTTGFDFPELATIVLARPTMSLALYYQMCGRAIRPYEDKTGWIIDLCGNYDRFGRVEDLYLKHIRGKWGIYSRNKELSNIPVNLL